MGDRNDMRFTDMRTLFALLVVVIGVCDAVWKPQGNMHAHELPERLFKNGDTNNDDHLDAAELKEFYKHDEDQYHGSEIAKHFGGEDKATAALDLNKDGKIDASEFLKYADPAYSRARAWDDFDLANKDGDIGLDVEEYKKTHYGKERVIDANHGGFTEHHGEIDKNKDGKIDKDEWLNSPAAQDAFSHMDYDGNELVTLEEMMRNEREHYHGMDHDHEDAIKHSKEAFDQYDRNGDGVITRAEDRSNHWQSGHDHGEYEKMDYDDDEDEDEDEEEEDEEQPEQDL